MNPAFFVFKGIIYFISPFIPFNADGFLFHIYRNTKVIHFYWIKMTSSVVQIAWFVAIYQSVKWRKKNIFFEIRSQISWVHFIAYGNLSIWKEKPTGNRYNDIWNNQSHLLFQLMNFVLLGFFTRFWWNFKFSSSSSSVWFIRWIISNGFYIFDW